MEYIKVKKGHYNVLKDLSDKQAGELVKAVCAYAFEGKPYTTKDGYLKGLFMYAQHEIEVVRQNSINGKKGAERSAELRKREQLEKVCVGRVVVGGGTASDFIKELLSTIGENTLDEESSKMGKIVKK